MLRLLSVLLGLAALSGCASVPPLDLDSKSRSTRELVEKSSLIVLGTVADIQILGPLRTAPDGRRYQLWRVDVSPELTIKGNVESKRFSYFLNNYAAGFVQNGDFDWLNKRDRRIFFLRQEGPLMRAVVDLRKSTIVFPQTTPMNARLRESDSTGQKIARLLLTSADEEPPVPFATSISHVVPDALRSGGYAFTALLLEALLQSRNSNIRAEACLALYDQAFGDEACIARVESSDNSSDLAMRIRAAREQRDYIRRIVRRALDERGDSPFLTAYTVGVEYADPRSVREFFEYLAKASDQVLRLSAETQLTAVHMR